MSENGWRERSATRLVGLAFFAVILLILGAGAVGWGYLKQTEYQGEAYQNQREYSNRTEYPARDACLSFPFHGQANCIAEARNKSRENERAEQDLVAQRVTAIWTFLMGNAAIVGMMLSSVGVYLVWTTFNATREANTLAKRALFNSERPYLCIDVRDSRFVAAHDSQEGRANLWQWSFTNMGVSPARLTHTHVESVYLPAGQWPPPIHRSMTGGSAFPHGLFIGSSKVLHAQVFRIKEFDPETSERLLVQNLYAWIYGFICYESIAGDAYITGFCLKNGNGDHVGEVSLQGGETYNYFRGDDPNAPPAERVRSGDIPIRY